MHFLARLFGHGQAMDRRLADEVLRRVANVESAMRTLELEQVNMHEKVLREMRRAVQARRRAEGVDTLTEHTAVSPPAVPSDPRLRRATLLAALRAKRAGQQVEIPDAEESNGIHP